MTEWRQLAPMPRVSPWNKGKRSKTWADRRDEYQALPKQPMVITAELVTPVIHAERDQTHLDSILSFAAITDHPVASAYEDQCVLPLPLELLWVSPSGQPLWACTPLVPAAESLETREYWHKRYPTNRAEFGDRLNAITTAGRWKEYRVPVRASSISRLHALAIGNLDEVQRLLEKVVTHIGKKGAMGYGRVARWSVTPTAHSLDDILRLRPVPVAYYAGKEPHGRVSLNRGWTSPYWYTPWWADCVVPDTGEVR